MMLLPILCALAVGLAFVAALAPSLSRLQLVGAAMALGPAALAGLMSLAFVFGVPRHACAWSLACSAVSLAASGYH